uniref:Uncharacterized protein n=1 Tax=Nelumbo nucifera TaxID=4432 RepID=A0A822ZGV4_NELNU|nr:TPA_asm: hypothetical protein HUJ06_001121 [Nelumbo nucifera]
MIWVLRRRQMGLRKEVACLFLLLLMLLQLETPCSADGYGRFGRFRGGSASKLSAFQSKGIPERREGDKDGDEVFGVDKRKIYTGPNPLHNR